MEDWFSVNKIDEITYVISEVKHWEKPNCYLLIGKDKAALIDTGLGIQNIRKKVEALTSLPIIVLTTHVHWDHIGGHNIFDYFGVPEVEEPWINGEFPLPLNVVKMNLAKEENELPDNFILDKYQVFQGKPDFTYKDGDLIDLGNRMLKVFHTPGHSPGHCCFYEQDKYLFSGDLVYKGTLDAYYPTTNSLNFYESIKRIKELKIKRILPGHFDFSLDPNIAKEIYLAFSSLNDKGILGNKNGVFEFGNFNIHI